MVLESCMILLDNSEYMRNGDYVPTRLEAQHDAANFLVGTKTQSNPENTVGVIAMCGSSGINGKSGAGELLVSPTDDMGKILSALHGIPVRKGSSSANSFDEQKTMDRVGKGGGVDIVVSLQVANLALKHRRNKNGAQRVIVFVGSPLTHVDSRALVRAGRMLKKNNLAIDVIAMGELDENEPKLQELVDAANGTSADDTSERTCHLVTIPAGVLPSDVLVSSPIVNGGAGMSGGGGSSGGVGGAGGGGSSNAFSEFGGVDPNMDPELAMALRVSMEEERARQERAAAAAAAEAENNGNDSNNNGAEGGPMEVENTNTSSDNANAASDDAGIEVSEEDALLQQALAMSMASGNDEDTSPAAEEPNATEKDAGADGNQDTDMMEDDDEDAAMQLALQMSMQPDAESEKPSSEESTQQQFQDPQFVNQLLGSLPDDANDALRNMLDKKDKKDDDKKDGK